MASPAEIERSILKVKDQASFIRFLIDTLEWPITGKPDELGEISYRWTQEELRAADLDKNINDGLVLQIANLHNKQPWGVFVLEFNSAEPFVTERGMAGPLRKILRGLVHSRTKDAGLPSWSRPHLLFICTHKYEHFRFAYFKAPPEESKTAPLAAFGWGPDIPARTACEFNLPPLQWPDDPNDGPAWVSKWADAFNVEKVTKRFYTDYAAQFEKVRVAVKSLKGEEQKMFTQTLLNRLMFLRFIERKGWLQAPGANSSRDYLRLLFQSGGYRGKSFYSGRLRKLFFDALATEGKQESEAVGKVPFLNGGLFEEGDLDKKVDDIDDKAFAPLLGPEGLFYRYNFTVQESTPLDIEVAVDPEMLGKVFEELVTGRHESGSYYTPRPIVSFMCREALKGYLTDTTKLDADAVAAFIDKHDVTGIKLADARKIAEALDTIRAVDPACGSGAYLLGLLHEIVDLYHLLYSDKLNSDSRALHAIKLDIIQNCLYGVDIDPFATNIAMLRLWLSLAVDCDVPLPLPNLKFKIKTGDSLTGPDPSTMPDLFRERLRRRADLLVTLKEKYQNKHDPSKIADYAAIVCEERAIAKDLNANIGDDVIDWRIHFAEVFAGEPTHGTVDGMFPVMNEIAGAQRKILVGERIGGFDIVLANPPYLDSETMAKHHAQLREKIRLHYTLTKGNWDIYIAFFERGFQLLNAGGILSFITPDKWLSKPFGEELRTRTVGKITSLLNVGRDVFQSANVDAIVSTFHNRTQQRLKVFQSTSEGIKFSRCVEKTTLSSPYSYDWLFSECVDLLSKIDALPHKLSKYGLCENSCATSDAYKLKPLLRESQDIRQKDVMRIVNTGTIGKYLSKWGEREMVYLGDRYKSPVIVKKEFLAEFPNSYGRKSVKPKIIIKGLNLLDACLDADGTIIPGKTTLIVTSNDLHTLKFLLAIINSSAAFVYLKNKYLASSYNKGTTFTKEMINELPLPAVGEGDRASLVELVDRLISAKSQNLFASAATLQTQIDERVAALYGLSLEGRILSQTP